MKAFESLAVEFAQSLVDARWEDAQRLLAPELRKQWTADALADEFSSMCEDSGDGPAESIEFDPQFSMETWPDKQPGDVGWAYVSVLGDGFVEAVTVVVAASDAGLAIRSIEWGRP